MPRNKLLYAYQYGLRKLHPAELEFVELVEMIRLDIAVTKYHYPCSLILSKAFDTLEHTILLQRLKFYGVSGTSLQRFASYLMNRHQLVDIDGTYSTVTSLITGVPQGSILRALPFTIDMNDIQEASKKFHAMLYDVSQIPTQYKQLHTGRQNKQSTDRTCHRILFSWPHYR